MNSNLEQQLLGARTAGHILGNMPDEKISAMLQDVADTLVARMDDILAANAKDLALMDKNDPRYDRLLLNTDRIVGIANDLRTVARLPSPIGHILEERTLESGLELKRVSVPLGVIAIIYESRPNVTFDVFSLCIKSGNACVLKGGKEARHSNEASMRLIHSVLEKHGIDPHAVELLMLDRKETDELLQAEKYIDVIIPRGGQELITYVREHARVPVIETGAGIVHTYVDTSADVAWAANIVMNAKTRRPSVCNALDTLIIHEDRLSDLPRIVALLAPHQVTIFADEKSYAAIAGSYPAELLGHATEEHFGTEFLSLKMSIKTVASVEEAVDHISTYSSKHSEAIIASHEATIEYFLNQVDAAVVYANASTGFTDGAQFGMGAEIGTSTQKLHARGSMGLRELTSYKWIVRGHGEVRTT